MAHRHLLGLLACIAATLVAIGMLTSLAPLRGAAIGFDAGQIGWVASAYYLGFIVGPWLAPPLVGRLGPGGAFVAAAIMGMTGVVAMPFLPYLAAWTVLRLLSGTGFAMIYILVEAGLNAGTGNAARGRLLSVYLIVSKCALIGGQMLIGAMGVGGAAPFMVAALMLAIAGAVGLTAPPPAAAPARVPAGRLRPLRLLRAAPVAMIGCFLYGVTEASFFALGPLFARANGLGVAQVSAFMSAMLLGGALLQFPLGLLSDRIDRRKALLLGALGAVVAGAALGSMAQPGFTAMIVGGFVFGAFLLPLYALFVALAQDNAAADERVAVSSGMVLAYAIGAVIGPPLAAMAMSGNARGLPLFQAGVYAVLAVFLLLSLRRPAAPPLAAATVIAENVVAPDLGPDLVR